MTIKAANRNLLWAKILVDELARGGLRHVVIAPGSRSTPLVFAFAEQPEITVYSHIDERGAAFMALGLALAIDAPVAVLCTSGTAAANFYPAIVEAHYARAPLLVLTADRAHELRESGANQTVDQVKMYGDHVLWSVDLPLPEANPPPVAIRNLRTLAARALATANGMPKGAVHFNVPFRKPLEPTVVEGDLREVEDVREEGVPFTHILRGAVMPSSDMFETIAQAIQAAERPIMIAGPYQYHGWEVPRGSDMVQFSRATGVPLFADPLSDSRHFFETSNKDSVVCAYDTFLRAIEIEKPDLILHFGAMPISQTLADYTTGPNTQHIWINSDDVWRDAEHQTGIWIIVTPSVLRWGVQDKLHERILALDKSWRNKLFDAERETRKALTSLADDTFFDGLVLAETLDLLPNPAALFVANSLPVRHLDQFGMPSNKNIRVFCNRGASGIDGTISSAFGAAAGLPKDVPLVCVLGDLAFYHDMNALLLARRAGLKVTFIVINNDGGGIFRRLPVAEYDPPFTDLFLTPHGMTFEHTAAQFGVGYARADTRQAFRAALSEALAADETRIIEVVTNADNDAAQREAFIEQVRARLASPTTPITDQEKTE